jgi:hypothetical protein
MSRLKTILVLFFHSLISGKSNSQSLPQFLLEFILTFFGKSSTPTILGLLKVSYFVVLIFPLSLFSQSTDSVWYFGENAGIDFNTGVPVPLLNGSLVTVEGCASIASPDGSLLFYTDGIEIYNKNHVVMLNGDGLGGHISSTHSAIIVPKPASPNIYYVFTTDANGGASGLQYSEVDISLDNGLGAVTSVKNSLLITPTDEKIVALKIST